MLFVVQTLFLGFTLGAHAAPTLHDQFGNVICTDGSTGAAPPHDRSGHDGEHACCVLAVSASAAAHLLPTLPPALAPAIHRPVLRLQSPHIPEDRRAAIVDTPRNTRAPPFDL